jgi:hypothetical protein
MKLWILLNNYYKKNKSIVYLLLPVFLIILFFNFTIRHVSEEVWLYIRYWVLLFLTVEAVYLWYDTYCMFKNKTNKK